MTSKSNISKKIADASSEVTGVTSKPQNQQVDPAIIDRLMEAGMRLEQENFLKRIHRPLATLSK